HFHLRRRSRSTYVLPVPPAVLVSARVHCPRRRVEPCGNRALGGGASASPHDAPRASTLYSVVLPTRMMRYEAAAARATTTTTVAPVTPPTVAPSTTSTTTPKLTPAVERASAPATTTAVAPKVASVAAAQPTTTGNSERGQA